MVELEKLRVSITKNGYLKIAVVVQDHPSHEILDHLAGSHVGVNLQRSQVANILSADPVVPAFWDGIRAYDLRTIKAFTFLATVFSHHRLIEAFLAAGTGQSRGHMARGLLTSKEYTNLVFAMHELGLCVYDRNATGVDYDLQPLINQLRRPRRLVEQLLRSKLRRALWLDPDSYPASNDMPFLLECRRQRFHEVLGMTFANFSEWLGRAALPRR